MPQFQENYVEKEYENEVKGEIHQLDTDSSFGFLTKEEHDNSYHEAEELRAAETKDFQRGYQLAVMDLQRQIGLRNIDVPVMRNKDATNKASTSKPNNDLPPKDTSKNVIEPKGKERKEDNPRISDQGQTSFSLEAEIAKIKIFVPLTELLKNSEYHSKIATVLKPKGKYLKY